MAEQIAGNDWLCWDHYDVSGVIANAPQNWTQEVKDFLCYKPPTLGDADPLSRKRLVGAEDASMAVTGYLDFAVNYAAALGSIGVNDAILTRGFGRTAGSRCHLLVGVQGMFEMGGQVGEVVPFSADLSVSNSIVVPARLYEFGSKTATGDGTSQEIGAVLATQKLYLHAHVVTVSGTSPTIDLIYETSAIGDYSDAMTRHTFSQLTDVGKERAVVSGAITDTHGRFAWTIGGTGTPTFLVRLAAGIR